MLSGGHLGLVHVTCAHKSKKQIFSMDAKAFFSTRSHDQVVRIRRMIKKWLIRNNSYDLTRTN